MGVHHASFKLLEERNQTTIPFLYLCMYHCALALDLKELLPRRIYQYTIPSFKLTTTVGSSKNQLLFGGEGTGLCWSPEQTHDYLLGRIQYVFPSVEQVQLDFVWSGTTDFNR